MRDKHRYVKATDIRSARFDKFMQELSAFEAEQCIGQAQDRFLDAYSLWLHHQSPVTFVNLARAVERMHELDPAFHFVLPPSGGGLETDA